MAYRVLDFESGFGKLWPALVGGPATMNSGPGTGRTRPKAHGHLLGHYVAERLLSSPHLTLALFELRLEAARNPAVADVLTPFLRSGLVADQTFHDTAGLPGGPQEVQLLHWAIDGLVLAALTTGMDGTDPSDAARELTRRLLPREKANP